MILGDVIIQIDENKRMGLKNRTETFDDGIDGFGVDGVSRASARDRWSSSARSTGRLTLRICRTTATGRRETEAKRRVSIGRSDRHCAMTN